MRALLAAAVVAGLGGTALAARSLKDAPSSLTSSATLAARDEPGERLQLIIVLIDANDRPVAGAIVYAYHTDAKGSYGPGGSGDPRIFGYARADASGRVTLDTIKPGVYPEGGTAAHIHVHIGVGGSETVDECWFTGDRYLSEEIRAREQARGTLSRVLSLRRNGPRWQGVWTLVVGAR